MKKHRKLVKQKEAKDRKSNDPKPRDVKESIRNNQMALLEKQHPHLCHGEISVRVAKSAKRGVVCWDGTTGIITSVKKVNFFDSKQKHRDLKLLFSGSRKQLEQEWYDTQYETRQWTLTSFWIRRNGTRTYIDTTFCLNAGQQNQYVPLWLQARSLENYFQL